MICSEDNDAFGAPRPSDGAGEGVTADDSVAVGDGDSDGCAVGKVFFFRRGDPLGAGAGVGEAVGVSVGDGVGEVFFLRCGELVGVGVDDFFLAPGVGEAVGFGVGVGVGDFLPARGALFFLCGVGVGVANIFLSVRASDGSAASLIGAATMIHMTEAKMRRSME